MKWICALFSLLFLSGCAATKVGMRAPTQTLESITSQESGVFQGYGDILLSYNGEKVKVTCDVGIENTGRFQLHAYDAFGGTELTIIAEGNSASISIDDTMYTLGVHDKITAIPYFHRYPFTFDQLRRILCGLVPFPDQFHGNPDSSWSKQGREFSQWQHDSLLANAAFDARKMTIQQVTFESLTAMKWRLEFSRFKKNHAQEIKFETAEKNYFVLKLQRLIASGTNNTAYNRYVLTQ